MHVTLAVGTQGNIKVCPCAAAAKLVPVGFGIKKLQITCVIEDAKVESMDAIIEDDLVKCDTHYYNAVSLCLLFAQSLYVSCSGFFFYVLHCQSAASV